jgi:S-DNA-T family DNA segregation ATPase FtsK/SpoIIIE
MTLGDMDPAALAAARAIPAEAPGVAIVAGQDGTWHRARSTEVTEAEAEAAARQYAHLAPLWASLTATGSADPDDLGADYSRSPLDEQLPSPGRPAPPGHRAHPLGRALL